MAEFANYNQILLDMKNAVEGAALGFKRCVVDADDNDFQFQHMPMADFRIKRNLPELVSAQTYYSAIQIEVEIACFDMTSRAKCATMRNDLTAALQGFFQANPRFGGYVDSTVVGPVEFEIGETKAQGEFIAAAVATFTVFFYSEQ
jgi:hypothetical protein